MAWQGAQRRHTSVRELRDRGHEDDGDNRRRYLRGDTRRERHDQDHAETHHEGERRNVVTCIGDGPPGRVENGGSGPL